MIKDRWYHPVRYEYQRWSLWRWDLNLAYILKSFNHRSHPLSSVDTEHYLKVNNWLQDYSYPAAFEDEQTLSLSAVGDVMWIRSGWEQALSPAVKSILAQSDMTFANMETPIASSYKVPKWVYETLHYNAPVSYLTNWNNVIDAQHVFSICNNHALDQGEAGLGETRNSIIEQGDNFHCLGGVNVGEDIKIVNHKGFSIGFMASTFAINHLKDKQNSPQGVPLHLFGCPKVEPDFFCIAEKVKRLKEQGAEFIIYAPHWGYEYEYWPDELQRKHALKLIESGIDLIIGNSPHVLQPVEMVSINKMDETCPLQVERPGPKKLAVIAWSLGNFLTIMPTMVCKTGAILQLDLVKKDQQIFMRNLKITPVYTTRPEKGAWLDRQVMCLQELPAKEHTLKSRIVGHCQHISPLIVKGEHL